MKYIAGIDPGVTAGAIAVISRSSGKVVGTWVFRKSVDGGMDLKYLCRLISYINNKYKPIWYLEKIHSIFGTAAGSMFAMARGLGNIEATLSCNDCEFYMVTPKEWQKIWIESDVVYKDPSAKKKTKDTKATSLAAVKRLYPNESTKLIYGSNERISGRRNLYHSGIVDSILIARSQITNI